MRRIMVLVLIVGAFALLATAQEWERIFVFQGGHGAKALGMGGAFCALADDGTAALWNPAGLTFTPPAWIAGASSNLFGAGGFEGVPYYYVGGGFTFDGYAVGAGWANATAGPMYSASLFMGSVGVSIADIGSVGANVKYYMETIDEDTGSGFGFDLGLLFAITPEFRIGVVAQDVGGTAVWEGQTVLPVYRAGLALDLLEGAISLAADVGMVGMEFAKADIRAGLQFRLIETLMIRAGIVVPESKFDAFYFSVGAGLSIAGLTVDAAYILNPEPGETLVLSAWFSFGELFAPPAKVGPTPPARWSE